jgi:hypothetical protein
MKKYGAMENAMLLPNPERRGEIHFHLAKRLPYNVRMALALGMIASGFVVQLIFLMSPLWWAGLAVVLGGVSMLLPKGFDNSVDRRRPRNEWRPARREQIERIIEISEKQKRWDHDAVDISNGLGLLTLIGLAILLGIALFATARITPWALPATGRLLLGNAAVMLLPFWLTGIRSILKNDKLVIKARLLLKIEDTHKSMMQPGEDFQYQMQTAEAKRGAGETPYDVKALLLFNNAPPDFLGLQMQVAINSVQGRDYPYFYCVLVARPEFGGLDRRDLDVPSRDLTIESKREGDVDILVIRQRTKKNSGYHTKANAAVLLFGYALEQARRLITSRVGAA